jgi:hypothetical protein
MLPAKAVWGHCEEFGRTINDLECAQRCVGAEDARVF